MAPSNQQNARTEDPPIHGESADGLGGYYDETGQLVAVKIIDIEESDRLDPGANDAFNDILKELCDFGVAAFIEIKFDKRRTVTGSLQWMAPEFFEPTVSYDIEVDIWALGSMAFEMASGLPPNARTMGNMDPNTFGFYLRQHCPRLEGD
ncbi:hypothetical protein FHL15_005775 [Xylaria flabelliformis]|uniref:Protein kinase domain-containing protein n=1 Tax=Xylaria flabelliformis TaxID=2512241 RepID=A0A553HZ16_9PEZI|nr:hypothetical protein FHL15_005775 [Xylaria flabelliformis]